MSKPLPDTAEQLAALTKEHGKLVSQVVDGKLYAFKAPDLTQYEDYQERRMAKKPGDTPGVCYRDLAQRCCVTDQAELQALFKRYPAVSMNIANALADLAGAEIEFTVGKD